MIVLSRIHPCSFVLPDLAFVRHLRATLCFWTESKQKSHEHFIECTFLCEACSTVFQLYIFVKFRSRLNPKNICFHQSGNNTSSSVLQTYGRRACAQADSYSSAAPSDLDVASTEHIYIVHPENWVLARHYFSGRFRHRRKQAAPRSSFAMSIMSSRMNVADGHRTHPSIDNPFGFPLPVSGATILEDEVVKEGHLVKNLKRRLFTLVIDSDNFPCLIYTCVCYIANPARSSHHFSTLDCTFGAA